MASELDMGMKCIKYMLMTVNLMFVITAALIISVGTTIYTIYYDFDYFIKDGFYSPTNLLVAVGFIMLAISIFGCIGAVKESTAMINIFALMLFLVFILDVSAAIAAYCLQNGLVEMVHGRVSFALQNYYKLEGEHTEALDFVQSRLSCCGIHSPDDWMNVTDSAMTTPEPTTLGFTYGNILPNSCCLYTADGNPCDSSISYQNGCMKRLTYVISQSAFLLGTGALTIAFIQFVGIIFSVMLAKSIRQAKTDRERRKWEIREKMINNTYTQMEACQNKKVDNPMPVIYVPNALS